MVLLMGTVLSKFHNMPKGTLTYPSICIDHEYPEELPILIDAMPAGDLPILVESGGRLIMLDKKVMRSVTCLEKLLRVYPIIIFLAHGRTERVRSVIELLDLEGFNWT